MLTRTRMCSPTDPAQSLALKLAVIGMLMALATCFHRAELPTGLLVPLLAVLALGGYSTFLLLARAGWIALGLLYVPSPAGAQPACRQDKKPCVEAEKIVSSQTACCCEGLVPDPEGSGWRCRPGGVTTTTVSTPTTLRPTTTLRPSTTTTSTSRPSTTTTTIPLGERIVPERWDDPGDPCFTRFMSRSYPDLDNMLWDPRGTSVMLPDGTAVLTGKQTVYADQYTRQTKVYTMHQVLAAKIGRWVRDYGTRQQVSAFRGLQRDIKKFMLIYNFRDPGETYGWAANYVWGLWQDLLDLLANVRGPALPTDLACLVRQDWPVAKRGKKIPAYDTRGIFDPKRKFAPLTPQQCGLLHATHAVHEEHVGCLLDHDPNIPVDQYRMHVAACGAAYGVQVRAAHFAFTASARDRWEANLFDAVFTGDIDVREGDAFATVARGDAMTKKTSIAHDGWMEGFNCPSATVPVGTPPDQAKVILFTWKHGDNGHFRRAVAIPDMPTPEIVFHPVLEPVNAAAFPKCVAVLYPKRQADGGNSTYDVRTCPKPAE